MLDSDTPLLGSLVLADYGLDSLETVSLLLELEDSFDATIPDELLVAETFVNPAALWSVLSSLVSA